MLVAKTECGEMMNIKLMKGSAWLWVVLMLAAAFVPMPAVSEEAYYIYRQGTLAGVTVDIQTSPDTIHVNDTVTIAINISNPGASNISMDFQAYAGWMNFLANGTGVHIMPYGSHAITMQWTPLTAGKYPVGVNATDPLGSPTGLLCAIVNVTVLDSGAPVLSADISLPGAVYANESTTITIDIQNSGVSALDSLEYSVFAGVGNYIKNGTCAEIPAYGQGTVSVNWTPPAPGNYEIGVKLRDYHIPLSLDKSINVTIIENGSGQANPLAATVYVPENVHYVGDNINVTVVYSNTGPNTIYNIHFVIYAGWGNYIHPGGNGIGQMVPNETVTVTASWTPTAAGVYPVGTNASDSESHGVVAYIDVTVLNGTQPAQLSISLAPNMITATAVGRYSVLATVSNTGNAGGPYRFGQPYEQPNMKMEVPSEYFSLAALESHAFNLTLTISNGIANGNYTFTIAVSEVSTGNRLAESILGIIVRITEPPVQIADLSVSALEIGLTPNPVAEGTPCSVIVTVRNVGNANATGAVSVQDITGGRLGTQNVSIAPARAVNLTFAWTPSAGNHTIEVTVTTLSGGNSNTLNDVATKVFYILPKSPLPPQGRLRLVADQTEVSVSPGGTVVVTVHIICENAMVQGVYLTAVPSSGLTLSIEVLSPPGDLRSGDNWTAKLKIFAPPGIGNATHKGTVQVTVHGVGVTGDSLALHMTVVPEGRVQSETVVAPLTIAAVASVAVVAAAVIGGTEIGIIALTTLFLPLYVKLRKEEVLDQFTRGKIQGYITAYPGEHYSSIKAQLGLKNGALAYHLKVLEREGYIASVRDGVFKRFYPKEAPLPRRRSQYSAIQEMILEHIKERPGVSQDNLARMMKVSNQVINYHIKNLLATGAIKLERQGKETRCFLARVWDMGS